MCIIIPSTIGEKMTIANQKVNVVLVGCGGISIAWLSSKAVKEDVNIIGLVDIDIEAAKKVRDKYSLQNVPIGTNLAEMIDKTKPEAVFDLTIPSAHCNVTLTALEKNCHVLGEKPMAESMEDARRMAAMSKKTGKIYAVTQTRHYMPKQERLVRFLRSGVIGDITEVHADFFIAAHFGGFREIMKHVLILDMAIHSFDQARLITNENPLSVTAFEWNPKKSNYQHGASAIAAFEMTNGVIFTYRGNWTATGNQTSWECAWRIMGTLGSVYWNGDAEYKAELLADPNQPSCETGGGLIRNLKQIEIPTFDESTYRSGHDGAIADFIQSIRGGTLPKTECSKNIYSLAMVIGAVESAKLGKRVNISV